MSQTLYRFWDVADDLLYVGISVRPWQRWKEHRAQKPWWEEVSKITIENFATRKEVAAAELAAIRTEHPLYNIQGLPEQRSDAWDGTHTPLIAFVGDLLFCSCRPPDWSTCPDEAGSPTAQEDHFEWLMSQSVYEPEAYSSHVIEAVLGQHFTVGSAVR